MMKTYEGFLDIFKKKSASTQDILETLKADIEKKYYNTDYHINIKKSIEDNFILVYRLNITSYGEGILQNWVGLQDVFTITLDKNKKDKLFNCVINISREHNYDVNNPLRGLNRRKVMSSKEVSVNVNFIEVSKIVETIQSETSKLYNKIKTETKIEADKISSFINNIESIHKAVQDKKLQDALSAKEKRDKWKEKLLKDFDIDGVEDLVLDIKDEFDDVETRVFDEGGGIYYEILISNFIHSGDRYKLGLEIRKTCSDFIKRYRAAYGDEYDMDINISANLVYIRFLLGKYQDSDYSGKKGVNHYTGEEEEPAFWEVEEEDEYEEDEYEEDE